MLTGIDRGRHGRFAPRVRHHMRHGASLSPLTSLNCAYLPSPWGVGSPSFSRHSFTQSARLRRATRHSSLATSPLFSPTCGLFISLCALFPVPVLSFQQLADSFAKTLGGVGG